MRCAEFGRVRHERERALTKAFKVSAARDGKERLQKAHARRQLSAGHGPAADASLLKR